jgi:tetratricopeptide (TPR) repeat protein
VDAIVELTMLGASRYSGAWSHYRERKGIELATAGHDLATAEQRMAEVSRKAQLTTERQQRRDAAGSRKASRGDMPRLLLGGRRERAERALAINPNHVDAHRCRTASLIWLGRLEEAREEGNLCVRLSPHDPRSWMSQHHLLMATYLLRDYASAVEAGLRVLDAHPAASLAYRWIAAALAQLGRIDEAQAVLRRVVAVVVPLPIEDFLREREPWFTDAFYAHLQEGLCLARWTGGALQVD